MFEVVPTLRYCFFVEQNEQNFLQHWLINLFCCNFSRRSAAERLFGFTYNIPVSQHGHHSTLIKGRILNTGLVRIKMEWSKQAGLYRSPNLKKL